MTPLVNSPDAVVGSTHDVVTGIYVGESKININSQTINLVGDIVVPNITVMHFL